MFYRRRRIRPFFFFFFFSLLRKTVVCVCAGGGVQHPVCEEEQGGVVFCVLPELRPQVLPHPGRLRHPLPVRDERPDADLRQLCHVPGTFLRTLVSLSTSAVARLMWLALSLWKFCCRMWPLWCRGCVQSLKVWGKWDKLFKALKVSESL